MIDSIYYIVELTTNDYYYDVLVFIIDNLDEFNVANRTEIWRWDEIDVWICPYIWQLDIFIKGLWFEDKIVPIVPRFVTFPFTKVKLQNIEQLMMFITILIFMLPNRPILL